MNMRLILLALLLALSSSAMADRVSDVFDATLGSANGFVFCSALDVATTIYAERHGGQEENPLWRSSVNEHHYAPLILGNLAIVGLAYAFRDEIPKPMFGVLNVVRCGVAVHNYAVVK